MRFVYPIGVASLLTALCGCAEKPSGEIQPTTMTIRAARRAFHGAPPVIPHPRLGGTCVNCHNATGDKRLPQVGIAPANPHLNTPGMSDASRCEQCHIFQNADTEFVENAFAPWLVSMQESDPRQPPVVPHALFMREDCTACHAGPAARPEIRCDHAERIRCQQCHVTKSPTLNASTFVSSSSPGTL